MKNLSYCLLLILAFGCNSTKSKKDAAAKTIMEDGSFVVVSVMDNDVTEEKLTLEISESGKRVSGFSGCNTYFGAMNAQESESLFSGVAATKKFCATSMKTEKSFLAAMQHVTAMSTKGSLLNLTDVDGTTIIVLKK